MLSAVYPFREDERGRVVSQPVQGLRSSLAELGESAWQTVESSIPALPEGPVAVGSSWNETRQTRVLVGVTRVAARVEVTYTLREIRRTGAEQTAVIGVAMNLAVSQSVGAPNISASGRGQARGEVQFSIERGVLLRSTSTMQLDLTVTARGSNPSTINMTGSSELALQS
ncbi:MAG: hypothetical protein U0269_08685 [Polyangiales bacterium]